jgi:hypothetical protein
MTASHLRVAGAAATVAHTDDDTIMLICLGPFYLAAGPIGTFECLVAQVAHEIHASCSVLWAAGGAAAERSNRSVMRDLTRALTRIVGLTAPLHRSVASTAATTPLSRQSQLPELQWHQLPPA